MAQAGRDKGVRRRRIQHLEMAVSVLTAVTGGVPAMSGFVMDRLRRLYRHGDPWRERLNGEPSITAWQLERQAQRQRQANARRGAGES